MATFYAQIELDVPDDWNLEDLSSELYQTVLWVEVDETTGFDGVCNRVSVRPF
jgi:hypothetical protein